MTAPNRGKTPPLPLHIVKAVAHQDPKSRYFEQDPLEFPRVAPFRNNLVNTLRSQIGSTRDSWYQTASSQYNNFLFIAHYDEIYLYKPVYPNQSLLPKPELILGSPFKYEQGREGYLDQDAPNAINHLIVGDFGKEEILLAACDGGGVFSWTIRSIALILKEELNGTTFLHPWFQFNVGASAWGLAIHKASRLIAVSSNSKKINVFIPALSKDPIIDSDEEDTPEVSGEERKRLLFRYLEALKEEWDSEWAIRDHHDPSIRSHSVVLILEGHRQNIPNIAFYNTDLETERVYLASTDITGWTYIWDVWSRKILIKTQGNSVSRNDRRGWGVACLDLQMSLPTLNPVETFGCKPSRLEEYPLLDNSFGARNIADSSRFHPDVTQGASDGATAAATPFAAAYNSDDDFSDNSSNEDAYETAIILRPSDSRPATEDVNLIETPWGGYEQHGSNDTSMVEFTHFSLDDHPGTLQDPSSALPYHFSPLPQALGAMEAYVASTRATIAEKRRKSRALLATLPFNLLQMGEKDIRLFRELTKSEGLSDASLLNLTKPNMVFSREPLHQTVPHSLIHLTYLERLNMIHQIPELGVVVVGSQAGRVGILTMTHWETKKQHGFKFEAIVPFKSQEDQGLRPKVVLMGMTISPVQGYHLPNPNGTDESEPLPRMQAGLSRRFRLLLIYVDHTVLSYEISRRAEDEVVVI